MQVDLAIVGGGPAGLAAASVAVEYGLSIVVIDEQARPGGQIYRQPPVGFWVAGWLSDRIYHAGKALLEKVTADERIQWLTGTTVLGFVETPERANCTQGNRHTLWLNGPQEISQVHAQSVLVASGCHDMAAVFPGWNLPGVMAAGGIQAMLKSQQIVPGERVLFAGTHPLQLIVAEQLLQAGGQVAGVVFAQKLSRLLELLRSPVVLARQWGRMVYLTKVLWRLLRAKVPISFGETLISAEGKEVLSSVSLAPVDAAGVIQKHRSRVVDCDRLGVCFNFLASSELARQAGADYRWSDEQGGWLIVHDEWMRTSVPGLYVAGEITGVAGAEAASDEGRLAALGILLDRGTLDMGGTVGRARRVRKRLVNLNKFATRLAEFSYPDDALISGLMSDNSIICKCQEVTAGTLKRLLRENPHLGTANAVKLRARTGMGLCQGRYCHYYVTKMLAEHTGRSESEIGPFTAQLPVKPIVIEQLIAPAK